MVNSHCYKFEHIKYSEGILDNFIDATYILTVNGSNRINNINKQLDYLIPTKNVFIVYNKGYKKCTKILSKQIPLYDIIDSNTNAFEHSLENDFNNILILEDDFVFSERLKDKNIIDEIKLFFNNNQNRVFYYNLGTFPLFFYPNINIFNNTYRGIFCVLAHANIYNKKSRIQILENINKNIKNINVQWDAYLTMNYINYFYKYGIIYQTFPETENKKYWLSDNKYSFFENFLKYTDDLRIKYLKLNKQPQPGFDITYTIFFILNYIFWISIIIIIIYFIYITFITKSNFKNKKFSVKNKSKK
jgi:hypothetical protein